MPDRPPLSVVIRLLFACALCLPIGAPYARGAEETSAEPWVQVELIAYRNLDAASADDEAWPKEPVIGYPESLEFLYDQDAADAAAPAAGTIPADPAAMAELQQAIAAEDAFLGDAEGAAERPYQPLPAEALQLGEAAKRIQGSRRYRLLRHVGWRQPRPPRGESVSVLLTGGDARADHFELEGYVTVSRSAFLHVAPTLWLNDFSPGGSGGSGGETGLGEPGGVLLPDIPRPAPPPGDHVMKDQGVLPDGSAPLASDATTPAPEESPIDAASLSAEPGGALAAAVEPAQAVAAEPLRSWRTVVMSASRRVKIGELHYLDHPLFGVLVQITAYEPAPAEAQTGEETGG